MPGLLGVRVPAGAPEHARERPQRVALLSLLANLSVTLDRAASGLDRLLELVGEVALIRVTVEQLAERVCVDAVGESQRPCPLPRCLTMSAEAAANAVAVLQFAPAAAERAAFTRRSS